MALHRLTDVDAYLTLLERDSQRGAQPVPGPAHSRHAVLPRSRVVRGAGHARVPGHRRGTPGRSAGPRLGVGLRDGRRGLFGRHRAARVAAGGRGPTCGSRSSPPTSATRPSSSPAPASIRRTSRRTSRRSGCGASSPEVDGGLSRLQAGPRPVRVRPPGPDQGSAVLAPRSDPLPQRADLHGRGAAEEAAVGVPLRAQAGWLPDARPGRDRRRPRRPVRARRQEAAHPSPQGRPRRRRR